MSEQNQSTYWSYITPLTNLIYNTNPPTNIADLQDDDNNKNTTFVETISEFDVMNNSALNLVQNLSDVNKLLLLVCIKRKYGLKPPTAEINKEILSVFYLINEVFDDNFQSELKKYNVDSNTMPLNILKSFYHYINQKLELQDFKPKFQAIIISEFTTEFKNLDIMNLKIIKSQLSVFNNLPTSNKDQGENRTNLFSKTIEDCHVSPINPTILEADEFISSQLELEPPNGDVVKPEEQTQESVGYFNSFTSGSLFSTIQGTLTSVYQREGSRANIIGFFNTSEPEKNDTSRIVTQIIDPFTGNINIEIDHKFDELINQLSVKTPYKAISKYGISREDTPNHTKNIALKYDNCMFLPSSNIKEYFHKRSIWSKIGLGIRDHYRLDNGDMHLYLSNKYDNELSNTKLQKLSDIKTNIIISFQVCDLRSHADANVTDQTLNSKIFTDICDDNLKSILKSEKSINKKITIDIPAISTDTANVDLIIEKVQKIFSKLDGEMNIFDDEMENLLFITNGESFNLLVMCLPYLKYFIMMKHQDHNTAKHFNFAKYPVRRLIHENINKTVTAKFSKVGILGLNVNPSHSPLYYSASNKKSQHTDIFYESLNWVLYNNITISLVADLYDCHQFPLQDKLLINFLHPHVIRGLNVQINQLDDDSNLLYTEDYDNVKDLKIPINRRFEVVLMQYLINFVNLGYNLNDTIPLFQMVSKIYESRAFSNLTRTPQLKKKLEKLKREFVDKMDKLHIDWKSIDSDVILKGFDDSGSNKNVEKLHYIYYCLIKKQLATTISPEIDYLMPDIKSSNIWNNNEVYRFFISNTLFTSYTYPQKNLIIFDCDEIAKSEAKEKEQFLLIWKLRDFTSNFIKLNNLPSFLSNFEEKLEKDVINNTYNSQDSKYSAPKADSIQCMKVLFKCYMEYKPPTNNRNLNLFKREILDMIWDVYESSDDFIADLVS